MTDADMDELKARRICFNCVRESYLRGELKSKGKRKRCFYCKKTAATYSLEELSEPVSKAFEDHYLQLSDDPDDNGVPVIDAIEDATEIPREAAEDLQQVLADINYDHRAAKEGEDSPFSDDSFYEERGVSDFALKHEWDYFERSLKSEARFFSRSAATHLASVFSGIDKLVTHDGRPIVVDAGPGTAFDQIYRARVFQSDDELKNALCYPDKQLGSPAMPYASAGRMNARGISVFYGANDARVAIAEVRPPVGSQVAVARFEIIRRVRLLDLGALTSVSARISIFEPDSVQRLDRAFFLRTLTERIIQPVMPDDEAFEYLPTQAVADFLATENDPTLDGIVFPSVQAAGAALNIVLFHKAALVEAIDLPKSTEISASIGLHGSDGWERWYSVSEKAPSKEESDTDESLLFSPALFLAATRDLHSDVREATLRIDLASIKVHIVNKVQYECEEYDVRRHRSEKK